METEIGILEGGLRVDSLKGDRGHLGQHISALERL